MGGLDLRPQGCSAPKSTSFALYYDAPNNGGGASSGKWISSPSSTLSTGPCCSLFRVEGSSELTMLQGSNVHSYSIPALPRDPVFSLRALWTGLGPQTSGFVKDHSRACLVILLVASLTLRKTPPYSLYLYRFIFFL